MLENKRIFNPSPSNLSLLEVTLLSIAKNKNGAVQAIQPTYLDPKTANKVPDLNISKRIIDSFKESFVDLTKNTKNQPPDITFVAEGVKTALTIRDAAKIQKNEMMKSDIDNLNNRTGKTNNLKSSQKTLEKEII